MSFSALILGRRRQGKSTLALAVAAVRSHSIVVFDPNCQYRQFPASAFSPEIVIEAMENSEGCLLVLRPDPAQFLESWQQLAEILWGYEDYSLVLDEASVLQNANWRDEWLERFIRQAPDSVALIQTTHRAVDIVKLSRALTTDLFLFRTNLETDLDLLSNEFPGLRADIARSLAPYQVLHYWTEEGGYERNCTWRNGSAWFIDIARADAGAGVSKSAGADKSAGAGSISGIGSRNGRSIVQGTPQGAEIHSATKTAVTAGAAR